MSRLCKICNIEKPIDNFLSKKKPSGKVHYYRTCKQCMYPIVYQREKSNPETCARRNEQRRNWKKESRQNPNFWARYIYHDTRNSDKKHGRNNDLTYEFIFEIIQCACPDCGRSGIRMTLDRIDNSLGHTQDNVRPCCVRCNDFRSDMPYDAWCMFAPIMRHATDIGLLDAWRNKNGTPGGT